MEKLVYAFLIHVCIFEILFNVLNLDCLSMLAS